MAVVIAEWNCLVLMGTRRWKPRNGSNLWLNKSWWLNQLYLAIHQLDSLKAEVQYHRFHAKDVYNLYKVSGCSEYRGRFDKYAII